MTQTQRHQHAPRVAAPGRPGERLEVRAIYRWEDDGGYIPGGRVMTTQTHPPTPVDSGATFDLERIAGELRAEDGYVRDGHVARTLVRSPDLRIVVIALAAGKTISEHQASATASVQTLSGHIRLTLPDRAVDLPVGRLLVLGAGVSHDVYAENDSTFVLTLGWPAKQ